jgi:hypothetical protein
MGYAAVAIEHAFAPFVQQRIGQRGFHHAADVSRSGNVCAPGEVIEPFADHFEQRAAKV